MAKKKVIRIDAVEVPSELYPRSKRPTEKDVQHLIGVDFPPITTAQLKYEDEDGNAKVKTVLVDGAHRLEASRLGSCAEVPFEDLGLMSADDILDTAVKLNNTHGKQLSMADKAKLAKLYTENGWKIKGIVSILSVGERTVSRWVQDAKEAVKLKQYASVEKNMKKGMSLAGAAREAGVARSTAQGWIDNPPEKKERNTKSKDGELGLTSNPAETECPDRVEALADMIVQDCADIAKEMDETSWVELAEAVYKRIRSQYPKSWKS